MGISSVCYQVIMAANYTQVCWVEKLYLNFTQIKKALMSAYLNSILYIIDIHIKYFTRVNVMNEFELLVMTSEAWLNTVLQDFSTFLIDHAANERKASAMALSMLTHYPDRTQLVTAMTDLAIEELNHFRQVIKLIQDNNIELQSDVKDPYIMQLRDNIRSGRDNYFLDRLLVASIVEKRGSERFALLATGLTDAKLQHFYQNLAKSESKHYLLFLELAYVYFSVDDVVPRLKELLKIESEIIVKLPLRSALH